MARKRQRPPATAKKLKHTETVQATKEWFKTIRYVVVTAGVTICFVWGSVSVTRAFEAAAGKETNVNLPFVSSLSHSAAYALAAIFGSTA